MLIDSHDYWIEDSPVNSGRYRQALLAAHFMFLLFQFASNLGSCHMDSMCENEGRNHRDTLQLFRWDVSFPITSKALEPKVTLGLSGPRGCLRACFPRVLVLLFFGGGKGASQGHSFSN